MRHIQHFIYDPLSSRLLLSKIILLGLFLGFFLFAQPSYSVLATELAVGTQVKVLEFSKLSPGLYATKIKVTDSQSSAFGKELWVAYQTNNPQLTFENPQIFNTPSAQPISTKTNPAPTLSSPRTTLPAAQTQQASSSTCVACSHADDSYQPFLPRTPSNGIRAMAKSCQAIIAPNGRFGSHGERIAEEISKSPYKESFLNLNSSTNPLGRLCPKFANLDQQNKTRAWVLFFAALAQEEAGCRLNQIHGTHLPSGKVLNPTFGYGYWALEHYEYKRSWRGKACQGNITSIDKQVACTVSIMHNMQLSRGLPLDARSNKFKYWGPTFSHRIDRQILPHMRRMSSCF